MAKRELSTLLSSLLSLKNLKDSISRSIWCLIILDNYVDFEKLYTTLDKSYDHNNKSREFAGGFLIVKKDHATAHHPILSESDWFQAFNAWMDGVIVFYLHCKTKLASYWSRIIDFFCSSPSAASLAIVSMWICKIDMPAICLDSMI